MHRSYHMIGLIISFVLMVVFSGCASTPIPTPEDESSQVGVSIKPDKAALFRDTYTSYRFAYTALRKHANSPYSSKKLFLGIPPIENISLVEEKISLDLNYLVSAYIKQLMGNKLIFTSKVITDSNFEEGDNANKARLTGNIISYQKDVPGLEVDMDLDALISSAAKNKKFDQSSQMQKGVLSNVKVKFCLKPTKSKEGFLENCVENNLRIFKGDSTSLFAVYNTLMGFKGAIKGPHDADAYGIGKLIGFTIYQLLGNYYSVPYWRKIGGLKGEDIDAVNQLKAEFNQMDHSSQIMRIQKLLNKYNEQGLLRSDKAGNIFPILPINGLFSANSHSMISTFLSIFSPNTPVDTGKLDTIFYEMLKNGNEAIWEIAKYSIKSQSEEAGTELTRDESSPPVTTDMPNKEIKESEIINSGSYVKVTEAPFGQKSIAYTIEVPANWKFQQAESKSPELDTENLKFLGKFIGPNQTNNQHEPIIVINGMKLKEPIIASTWLQSYLTASGIPQSGQQSIKKVSNTSADATVKMQLKSGTLIIRIGTRIVADSVYTLQCVVPEEEYEIFAEIFEKASLTFSPESL